MYTTIIPSLGRRIFLDALLVSIHNQTIQPSEIIILLDDNKYCKELSFLSKKFKNVKLFFCKNMNPAQKRNYGATLASSDVLIFSDDDDIWHYQRAAYIFKAFKKYDVCCHNFNKFGDVNFINCSKLGDQNITLKPSHLLRGSNIFGGGSSIACKKSTLLTFPFLETLSFGEDFEWWIRLIISEVKVVYLAKSLVSYRVHSSNMTKSTSKAFYSSTFISYLLLKKSLFNFLFAFLIFIRAALALLRRLIL
jgi:glycosyltransferase involved in cell wall biosynthesis